MPSLKIWFAEGGIYCPSAHWVTALIVGLSTKLLKEMLNGNSAGADCTEFNCDIILLIKYAEKL